MNKKGWIKIVEASISIVLIAGVLLIFASRSSLNNENFSREIYRIENSILRDIQLNETLREEIINIENSSLPLNSEEDNFPEEFKDKISDREPDYLSCEINICSIESECGFWKNESEMGEVYSQDVIIFLTLNEFNPRRTRIFCWT